MSGEAAEVVGRPVSAPRWGATGARVRARPLRRTLRSVAVLLGAACALVVVLMAAFAGVLAPTAPDEQNFDLIETPPGAKALLGTDRFGRNVISRVMYVFFSIPGLLLAVGIAAMRGPGLNSAVIAIAILYTPIFARIMRAPVLGE